MSPIAHSGHSHGVAPGADRRRLTLACALIVGFMAAEVAAGLIADSVALLSDAGHMLTDAGALLLALFALRLAARPPRGAMTYGLARAEPFSALINGVVLLVLAGGFIVGASARLASPAHVHGGLMLAVALAGIPVNLGAAALLARANRRSINIEGAFQHIVTDLYAFIATAIAAIVVLATGFDRADPIAALFVAALMLRAGWRLLRSSGRIFLEAAPEGVDPEEVGRALAGADNVVQVHDLHVWELTSGFPALSAHVIVATDSDCHTAREALDALLRERFGIGHSTLQVEHEPRRLLTIE